MRPYQFAHMEALQLRRSPNHLGCGGARTDNRGTHAILVSPTAHALEHSMHRQIQHQRGQFSLQSTKPLNLPSVLLTHSHTNRAKRIISTILTTTTSGFGSMRGLCTCWGLSNLWRAVLEVQAPGLAPACHVLHDAVLRGQVCLLPPLRHRCRRRHEGVHEVISPFCCASCLTSRRCCTLGHI